MGHQKVCHNMHNGNPRRIREKEKGRKYTQRVNITEHFPKLTENINLHIQEDQ